MHLREHSHYGVPSALMIKPTVGLWVRFHEKMTPDFFQNFKMKFGTTTRPLNIYIGLYSEKIRKFGKIGFCKKYYTLLYFLIGISNLPLNKQCTPNVGTFRHIVYF